MGADPTPDEPVTAGELDDLRPYLGLARAIRDEVERFTSDDTALVESFVLALDALPTRERARLAREVFDELPAEDRWAVLARVFDDAELRSHLAEARDEALRTAAREAGLGRIVARARERGRLDLADVTADEPIVIGLFRPVDTAVALSRGAASTVCARQLSLLTTADPGRVRVVDDRFNPRGGLFVGADYDEATWRSERLPGHVTVGIGSVVDDGTGERLEPVLYAGARVDIDRGDRLERGRLHLGFVLLGGRDVFAGAA